MAGRFDIAIPLVESLPRAEESDGCPMVSHETCGSLEKDGHRMVMRREVDRVRCQSRSGRDSTSSWPDLAAAGMALEPGTILDGEAVIFRSGIIDFSAAQSRMASSPVRAAALARQQPASYAFDILAHPQHGDV
jgi:ATP-dependent DNA ligase